MNETERMQFIDCIEMLSAVRRESIALQAGIKITLSVLPAKQDGEYAARLHGALAHLENAAWAVGNIIVSMEAALSSNK